MEYNNLIVEYDNVIELFGGIDKFAEVAEIVDSKGGLEHPFPFTKEQARKLFDSYTFDILEVVREKDFLTDIYCGGMEIPESLEELELMMTYFYIEQACKYYMDVTPRDEHLRNKIPVSSLSSEELREALGLGKQLKKKL